MQLDTALLDILIYHVEKPTSNFTLTVGDKLYKLADVSIVDTPMPVTKPTTRGGVYFAAKSAYKITGTINDLSIVSSLSQMMLGPNTTFGDILINTTAKYDDKMYQLELHANLISSVQTQSQIELHMLLVGLEQIPNGDQ